MSHEYEEIEKKIQDLHDIPKPESVWRHYKGDLYKVKGLVIREADEEFEVVYENYHRPLLYPWTRPLKEWIQEVEYEGKMVKRFKLVN